MNKPGFIKVENKPLNALIVSIKGLEGRGKTHFSLTAPGDIAFFSIDLGTRGIVEKFADEKTILEFPMTLYRTKDEAMMEWDRYMAGLQDALSTPSVRTIVRDTETELFELIRLAHFGRVTEVPPLAYTPCYADYKESITMFYDAEGRAKKNVIMLHKCKEKYINKGMVGIATGEMIRAGYKDIAHMVQINGTVEKDIAWTETDRYDDEENRLPDIFHPSVFRFEFDGYKGCRMDPTLDGTDLKEDFCNFPMMAMLATGSNLEDWE